MCSTTGAPGVSTMMCGMSLGLDRQWRERCLRVPRILPSCCRRSTDIPALASTFPLCRRAVEPSLNPSTRSPVHLFLFLSHFHLRRNSCSTSGDRRSRVGVWWPALLRGFPRRCTVRYLLKATTTRTLLHMLEHTRAAPVIFRNKDPASTA